MSKKSSFLNSINYFRGIAIFIIVAWHCYSIFEHEAIHVFEKTIANLLAGGTSFFVFISGFMFHHVFYTKFDYKKFIINKCKNIVVPYLIMSIIPMTYSVFLHPEFFRRWNIDNQISAIIFFLFTGRHLLAYWYIPFAMLLFLLSPLFIAFIQSNYKLPNILFWLTLALFIQRPLYDINPLHSLIYYIPIYMLGIWSSINQEKIYLTFKNKEFILLAGAIILAVLQAFLYKHSGNFLKSEIFTFNGIDLALPQKILLCLFFMTYLKRFESVQIKILEDLASYSFGIYFIHPYILWLFKITVTNSLDNVFYFKVGAALITTSVLSFSLVLLIKKLLHKHSKAVIGC